MNVLKIPWFFPYAAGPELTGPARPLFGGGSPAGRAPEIGLPVMREQCDP